MLMGGGGRHVGAHSDPAERSSATAPSFIVHEIHTRHAFESDGSGVRTLRVRVLVKDRAAVAHWGVVAVPFLASLERVELKELTVVKPGGQRVRAADAPLEDIRLSGQFDEPMFSDLRAKRAVVASLQPGDRLEYEVAVHRSTPLIPGHFWADHSFFRLGVVEREVFEIDTPASRTVTAASRRGVESAPERSGDRTVRRWTHSQATPDAALLDPKRVQAAVMKEAKLGPDVRVSSFESWEEFAAAMAGMIADKAEPDDAIRARARQLTQGLATPDEQIRALFAFVSEEVRYVSLAFGLGRLEPRPAHAVLTSEFGDCKDKHVLLASLARSIGIDVAPVLVSSVGEFDERVPTPAQFDHVVSVVRRGAGAEEWLWMDSTPGLLPPGALLAPFRAKRGLIAGGDRRERLPGVIIATPAGLPVPNRSSIEIDGGYANDGAFTARVTRGFEGDGAFMLRGAARHLDEEGRLRLARAQAAADGFDDDADVGGVEVEDAGPGGGVELRYEVRDRYKLEDQKSWRLWPMTPRFELAEAADGIDDPLDLGFPAETVLSARYELPVPLTGPAPVPVTLNRPYATYRSSYRIDGHVVHVDRHLRILRRFVDPGQFEDYRAFLRALDGDYRQNVGVGAVPRPAPGDDADALNGAGTAAYDRKDYPEAIRLLKRAVELDPKHRSAWNNLGRAYRAGGDAAAAVEALERQIAINAFDQYAHTNLGLAFWDLGEHQRAIEQFQKQLEISPLDKWAHANLGGLYLKLKQQRAAAESSERAVTIDPDYTYAWRNLAYARLDLGESEAALAAFREVMRLAPGAEERNNVAYALAVRGLHLEEAERLAREAIDETAQGLRETSLEHADTAMADRTRSLAAYWDTFGWVRYQRGDYTAARRFIEASWAIAPEAEVAEHLAMTYEKLGDRDRAIALYAAAAYRGKRGDSRAALERLVGPELAERLIDAAPADIASSRVMRLDVRRPGGEADLSLLMDENGRVRAARFLTGDEALRPLEKTVVGLTFAFTKPEDGTLRLVRRGAVRCAPNAACVLMPDPDARIGEARP